MAIITMPVIGHGTREDPYRVDLPTYQMRGEPDYVKKTVLVEIPDDELKADKQGPSTQKIQQKYCGNPKWDPAAVKSVE